MNVLILCLWRIHRSPRTDKIIVRTRAIRSVKNALSFGRRNSCEEKQSLFSRSHQSSVESDRDTEREDGEDGEDSERPAGTTSSLEVSLER